MKKFDFLYDLIFEKRKVSFLLILLLFVVFHLPIETLISNSIVRFGFKYILSTWYNDLLFFILLILIVIVFVHKFKRYRPSMQVYYWLLAFTFIYISYRFFFDTWNFTSLKVIHFVKYSDLLIIITILNSLLLIRPKQINKGRNLTDSFFDDTPIDPLQIDELGFQPYVDLLAGRINASKFDRAFAIGINGKWGMGKTSFINLLRSSITKDNVIEIEFNSWNSSTPKAIIQDFFETIQEKIRPYHSSLSRQLISYSNKLVSLNDNTFTQSIQSSIAAISGFESLKTLFDDINSTLLSIDKKIIVYIDDLDRLDKNEIIEVIRLIRNTANFYNTFFIVAYDRNYVISALKEHSSYRQEHFLEKIFQMEITLPYFNKDILRHKLAEKLKEKLPSEFHPSIASDVIGTPLQVPVFLNEWMENMRDVTRLANSIVLNVSKLYGEIVFNDFIRLELLRLKYPAVYEILFNSTEEFLENKGKYDKENFYELRNINPDEKKILPKKNQHCNSYLELHLTKNSIDLSVPKNEIRKIVNLIDGIFSGSFYTNVSGRQYLSVVHPSKFNRYFAYSILKGSLSEIEFSKARSLTQIEFNKKIAAWVDQGLSSELKNRFNATKSFDNRTDFEKVISGIFHLASRKISDSKDNLRNFVGYDSKDLYDKLSNYNNKLVLKYYPEQNGIALIQKFVADLFSNAQTPYLFEAGFLRHVNEQFSNEDVEFTFPLSKEECKQFNLNYLKRYCSDAKALDDIVWALFRYCKQKSWTSQGGGSYQTSITDPPEALSILAEFVLRVDFDSFLLNNAIKVEPFSNIYAVSEFVTLMFGSWSEFKTLLEGLDENKWKYLKEFKEFFYAFEAAEFKRYIDFKFSDIPIPLRES